MTRAIVRELSPAFADSLCLAPPERPIDVARARAQHGRYVEALGRLVERVVVLPADPGFPDCCFIEDTAVCVGDRALLTRPGAISRRGEIAAVAEVLRTQGLEVLETGAPATLDGGDVLLSGDRLFVGLSTRTNAAGADSLRRAFPACTVIEVPVDAGLHLKSAVTALGPSQFLVEDSAVGRTCWRFIAPERPGALAIWCDEPHAANALRIGATVLHAAGRPRLRAALERHGIERIELDMSELEKADGGLTCLSLLLG